LAVSVIGYGTPLLGYLSSKMYFRFIDVRKQ